MAFTMVGYFESQAANGLTLVAGIVDQHVNVVGDNIRIPAFASKLIGAFASGINMAEAQISTPSLEADLIPDLAPLDTGAEEPNGAIDTFNRFMDEPTQLTANEDMRFLVDNANNNEGQFGLVWLMDKIDPLPAGKIQRVRATSATTLVADTWSIGTLTFSQQLRAGTYHIAGLRAEAAGLIAARLVIPGSPFRPGVIGTDSVLDIDIPEFRNGKLGSWGTFEHTFPPQVEFLSLSADTAETVYLDLVGPF